MSSEPLTCLAQALRRMGFERLPGWFCLVAFDEPPGPADLALAADDPMQLVREGGETTLLVRRERLAGLLGRHPGARVQTDLAWIRFESAMDWELVGFLALVTSRLAEAGVPLGAVCGYSRDHLFVGREHLARALEVLSELFGDR
jgi:hypothetical protein